MEKTEVLSNSIFQTLILRWSKEPKAAKINSKTPSHLFKIIPFIHLYISTWTKPRVSYTGIVVDDLIVPKKKSKHGFKFFPLLGISLLAVCFLKTDVWVLREISTQPSWRKNIHIYATIILNKFWRSRLLSRGISCMNFHVS